MNTNIKILHNTETGLAFYGKFIGECEYCDYKHDWCYTLYLFQGIDGEYYQNYNLTKYVVPTKNVKHILIRIKQEKLLHRKMHGKFKEIGRSACRRDYNSALYSPICRWAKS